MNSVTLTGRLEKDVVIRTNTDGSHNVMFTLVPGKLPVRVFLKNDKIVPASLSNLKKDDTVLVSGRFQHDFWKNGQKLPDGRDAYSEAYYVSAMSEYVIPMSAGETVNATENANATTENVNLQSTDYVINNFANAF